MISQDIRGEKNKPQPTVFLLLEFRLFTFFLLQVAVSNSVVSVCRCIWRKLLKVELMRPVFIECFRYCLVAGLADSQLLPPCCTLPHHSMATFFIFANLIGGKWVVCFILHILNTNEAEFFSDILTDIFAIVYSSFLNCLHYPLLISSIRVLIFFLWF